MGICPDVFRVDEITDRELRQAGRERDRVKGVTGRSEDCRDPFLSFFECNDRIGAMVEDLAGVGMVDTVIDVVTGFTIPERFPDDFCNKRAGVCQDFSHILIGCLRALGLSAQYISGYLLTRPAPGQTKLRGSDASHAWVSVYCPGVPGSWLELDPTNNVIPRHQHVRLAVGRDFGDVSPLRGVIRGGGDHALKIAVTCEEIGV